jgi:hypothetical protein
MSVTLKTNNLSNDFHVLPPGSESAAFIGSISGNEWTGVLEADGEYTVRVHLMRKAARRNAKAIHALTVGITGGSVAAVPSPMPGLRELRTMRPAISLAPWEGAADRVLPLRCHA